MAISSTRHCCLGLGLGLVLLVAAVAALSVICPYRGLAGNDEGTFVAVAVAVTMVSIIIAIIVLVVVVAVAMSFLYSVWPCRGDSVHI